MKYALCFFSLFFSAASAFAWSLFGSANPQTQFRAADKLLEKADIAFDEGNYAPASNAYARAKTRYEEIRIAAPTFGDGLPTIRSLYCDDQISQCILALSNGGSLTNLPPASPAPSKDNSAKSAFLNAFDDDADVDATLSDESSDSNDSFVYDAQNFVHDFVEARDLLEQNRPRDSVEILIPMIKFDPQNRRVRMLLAAARLKLGENDLAIATLEDLRGKSEDLPLLLLLAGAYTAAGRYPNAMLTLDTAVKKFPLDPDPYSNLAWLSISMSPPNETSKKIAAAYYDQALRRGASRDLPLEAIIQ